MATAINENCASNITNSDIPSMNLPYDDIFLNSNSNSSDESDSSFGSITISDTRASTLNSTHAEIFHQRIKQEYDRIWDNEQYHCCYINDSNVIARACEYLRTADEGMLYF